MKSHTACLPGIGTGSGRCGPRRRDTDGRLGRGFTLVELLVVIAIIGVLVAMLLPAVQSAREAGRRTQCKNNLRQIGLGILTYSDARGVFPMGRDDTHQFAVSWAFRILPQVEEQAIFDAWVPGVRVDDPRNAIAFRTPVSIFVCPTRRAPIADRNFDDDDSATRVRASAAAGDYCANAGPFTQYGNEGEKDPTESGAIYTLSEVEPRQVADGTSKTFVVAERYIPSKDAVAPRPGFEHYDFGDTAFFAGDNPWTIFGGTALGFPAGPFDPSIEKFGSDHGNIAQVVFVDGHVEVFDYSMSATVLHALGAIADGAIIDEGSY